MSRSRKDFIKGMHLKEGALRHTLDVPKGKNISQKKMEKALHSRNPLTRKRAVLAKTLKNMHHDS